MSYLDLETRRVLEPFAAMVYETSKHIRALSDDDLALLIASHIRVSSTNCGWGHYEAARTPWIQHEAEMTLRHRKDLRLRRAKETSS